MRSIALASSLGLAACGNRPRPEPEVRIETASVLVAVGCVQGRPAPVQPLNQRVPETEWAKRAPGAKARSIEVQAGLRMNNADLLAAATSACPDAPPR